MRTAIVTGASGVIGRAIVSALYASGSWSNLVLVGRQLDAITALAGDIGPSAVPWQCDITCESSVEEMFRGVVEQYGPIGLLVNSAGSGAGAPTPELSAATFSSVLEINVVAPFLCCREAFKAMGPAGGGRIVNVGSISAMSPRPHSAAYTSSKFALAGLTQSLALDGRALNIAVGAVHPGNVESALLTPEQIEKRRETEGFVRAEDVASSVLHMASLPLSANVLEMTVMPTSQPLVGRG